MKKIVGYLRPFAHIYGSTVLLMFLNGIMALGTFAALPLLGILGTSLLVSAAAWLAFMGVAVCVCLPLGIKRPGIALTTLFGTIAGAAGIVLVGWILPGTVLASGFAAAMPFALVNTLAIFGFGYFTGSLKKGLTFWPKR